MRKELMIHTTLGDGDLFLKVLVSMNGEYGENGEG